MEASAAGERIGGLDDLSAGPLEPCLRRVEIAGVEDHQRTAGLDRSAGIARPSERKAAGEAAVIELAIVRTEIPEGPAEGFAIKRARTHDVADGEFDIVDALIVAGCGHGRGPSQV